MTLSSVAYVREGATWPPVSENVRVQRAHSNVRLYRGDFSELNPDDVDRSQLRFRGLTQTPQLRVTFNMFRMVARLWPELVFGTNPVLDYDGADAALTARLERLTPHLLRAGAAAVKDCIRYGVGVLITRKPGMVEVVDPRFWFPVTAPDDLNDIRGHIIAYPYIGDPDSLAFEGSTPRGTAKATGGTTPDRIRIYRYMRTEADMWTCETAVFHYGSSTIGRMASGWAPVDCGSPPVASAVLSGDDIYGESLFDDLRAHVAEINSRETQLAEALDKHVDPHLAVPEDSIEVDEQGRARVSPKGMAIFVPVGAHNPEYVTWSPEAEAHVASVRRAEQRVYSLAGISHILVNALNEGQRVTLPSGTALRRLAIITAQRVRTYRAMLEPALRDIIRGALSDAYNLDPHLIAINWPPPLDDSGPDDVGELVKLIEAGAADPVDAAQAVNRVNRLRAVEIAEAGRERLQSQRAAPMAGAGGQ